MELAAIMVAAIAVLAAYSISLARTIARNDRRISHTLKTLPGRKHLLYSHKQKTKS